MAKNSLAEPLGFGSVVIAWRIVIMVFYTHPVFVVVFQLHSITKNSLPLVYLAIGQAIIVIGGGIDLSVGSLLLLGNVIAARFMKTNRLALFL